MFFPIVFIKNRNFNGLTGLVRRLFFLFDCFQSPTQTFRNSIFMALKKPFVFCIFPIDRLVFGIYNPNYRRAKKPALRG